METLALSALLFQGIASVVLVVGIAMVSCLTVRR